MTRDLFTTRPTIGDLWPNAPAINGGHVCQRCKTIKHGLQPLCPVADSPAAICLNPRCKSHGRIQYINPDSWDFLARAWKRYHARRRKARQRAAKIAAARAAASTA